MSVSMFRSRGRDQRGIVSIIVTLILMIVITLMVLAFAKLSRREQQNAFDRQLSTQAFYAAESGVNFVKSKLKADSSLLTPSGPEITAYSSDCGAFLQKTVSSPAPVQVGANSHFTCVFYNPRVPSFEFDKGKSATFPFSPSGATDLEIYWDDATGASNFGAGCPVPNTHPASVSAASCSASVIRIEITNGALSNPKTFFAYPSGGGASNFSYNSDAQGAAKSVGCSSIGTPKKCKTTLSGLSSGSYIRVMGIYGDIALTAKPTAAGVVLTGGQAIIDVTGRAADVERRIQVRIPISGIADGPLYGLQGTSSICKKFGVTDTTAIDYGSCWGGGAPN